MVAISVILPVYNVEKYLQRCLKSLSQQTFKDFEVIAVNDGSKDNCLNILENFALDEKRLKIISQENKGLSEARNTGLKEANGEYIYFLDSDDAIHPQCLEIAYNFAKEHKADLISFKYEHSDGNTYNKSLFDIEKINYTISNTPLFAGVDIAQFNVWTKLYRRDFIKNIWFIPLIHFEDYPFSYAIYSKHPKTVFLDIKLYFYTKNTGSISKQTGSPKQIEDYFKGLKFVCDIYDNEHLRREKDFLKVSFIPEILKHQIGRIRRASKENKKEMKSLFKQELLELKQRGWIGFRGHKLKNLFTYFWLIRS